MFSDDLMGRCTPVLRCVVHLVCLNVVTHVTIYFRSGTGSLGGYIETVSKGALGYNHRQSIRKVGFDGKHTFFTTLTHDSDGLYFQGNFGISSLKWKYGHPANTFTAWLSRVIKYEVMLPDPVFSGGKNITRRIQRRVCFMLLMIKGRWRRVVLVGRVVRLECFGEISGAN